MEILSLPAVVSIRSSQSSNTFTSPPKFADQAGDKPCWLDWFRASILPPLGLLRRFLPPHISIFSLGVRLECLLAATSCSYISTHATLLYILYPFLPYHPPSFLHFFILAASIYTIFRYALHNKYLYPVIAVSSFRLDSHYILVYGYPSLLGLLGLVM